jgi:hypothetical protein
MKTKQSRIFFIFLFALFLTHFSVSAQKVYQAEKGGKWSISNRISDCDGMVDKAAFTKNLTAAGEWFRQNHPMMQVIKGFDLQLELENSCYSESHKRPCDYSLQGAIYFSFQIFSTENGKEGKWIVEPPQWKMRINSAWSGHGTNFGGLDGNRVQIDDPKLEPAINNAVAKISEFFCVFDIEKEIAPGIRLYSDGNLVIFNPGRPEYWIPVTVKEVLEAKMNYWKLKPGDKIVYDHFVKEYPKFTAEELSSWAYEGSDDAVIDVNGRKTGLQIMRFNPGYWDRSLPKSAIQFLTMYYKISGEDENSEFIRNNQHPDYPGMFMQKMDINRLQELLFRK